MALGPRTLRAALCALVLAGCGSDPPPALPEHFFTINANSLVADAPLRDTHLRAIADSGATAVRADVLWNVVENTPPAAGGRRTFDWAQTDRFVAALARAGLTWRPLLGNSPHWNRSVTGNVTSAPHDPRLAGGLATELLRRYGPGGALWTTHPELEERPVRWIEAWNEPNLAPGDNGVLRYPPKGYARFLRAVADGAHEIETGAQVIVGGLVPYPETSSRSQEVGEFLAGVARADPELPSLVDGVAVHVYDLESGVVFETLGALRERIDATPFAGVPLHLNETGAAVTPAAGQTREAARAAYLEEIVARTAGASGPACNVASVAPYTWTTAEADPADPQHWFGIANRDATLKPSAVAWRRGIAAAKPGDARCTGA
jgi:hypothetical protein